MSAEKSLRVLLALDGSDHSMWAFDWYVDNVHRPNNELVVAHCPDYSALTHSPMMGSDPALVANMIKQEQEEVEKIVHKIKEKLSASGVKGRLLRLTGDAGHAIVKAAENEKCDFIVTGSRGQGKLRRTLLGSVSDYVLHHSHVPVLVCRHKET